MAICEGELKGVIIEYISIMGVNVKKFQKRKRKKWMKIFFSNSGRVEKMRDINN
jgi:hypothetical protein